MRCPACNSQQVAKVHYTIYVECLFCRTIYTCQDIIKLIVRENDGPEVRNTPELMDRRLQFVQQYINPKTAWDFGCGNSELGRYLRQVSIQTWEYDKHHSRPFYTYPNVDAIFMVEVIEHLYDPHQTLRMLWGHLNPDGVIYIETTFREGLGDNPATHPYLDPRIGHVTILSRLGLSHVAPGEAVEHWENDNVVILQKAAP